MSAKQHQVVLAESERDYLIDLISKGTESARKLTRARILLKADAAENRPAYTDEQIVEALEVSRPTVERIRKTFVTDGLLAAIRHKKSLTAPHQKFDGEKEAHLITLACSQAPDGLEKWTLRLLADKMVELDHFESISHETIRRVLKKTKSSRG